MIELFILNEKVGTHTEQVKREGRRRSEKCVHQQITREREKREIAVQ